MAIELVIGYQGKDHVTAEQWADFNRGIFGDAAILPVGNRMETAIQTANQITVKDGVAVFDGREVYIGYGETENIAITSGTQGMLRRDIVVVEYTREEETGVESVQFKVINGTPAASNAQDPSVQDMDIRTGVFVSQKPFCRVRLNGTAIEGVDSLVQVKEFKDHAFADPVDNLTATDPSLALAATQGKALKQLVDQLNSALDKKQDSLKGGTYSGSLNTLKTPGIYWCNFAEVTGSIYSSGYGWVEVSTASSDGSALQRVYRLGEGNIITQIIIRPFVNNQWYGWRVLQMSETS